MLDAKWLGLIAGALVIIVIILSILLVKKEGYTARQVRKCTAINGTCIDTNRTRCSGTIHIGKCPGGNNIRCCVRSSSSSTTGVGSSCSSNGVSGTCKDKNTTACNGNYVTGKCPGPSNVQCCLPSSGGGSSSGGSSTSGGCTTRQYAPESQDAIDLLTAAAREANLPNPESWGSSPDTHYILSRESKGWVGIPNYTYGSRSTDKSKWCEVWAELKRGYRATESSATGLGQLLSSNAELFYPDGVNGIGNARNEAIGFLRYIYDRYGSPAVARSVYGRTGTYVNARTGRTQSKTFKEGY